MIPKPLQLLFEAAVAQYSYDQYAAFQKADMEVFEKLQKTEDFSDTVEKQSENQPDSNKSATETTDELQIGQDVEETTDELQIGQDVEIIHLKESDFEKFKRFAPAMWVKWAQKSALAMKAFESQLAFLKSKNLGYITEEGMVDLDGKKLEI